ncbi:MAG: c-type cytochrome [Burkholderiales bacterium]
MGLALAMIASLPASAQTPPPRASDFENGRQQFHRTCAQCHGRNMVNSGVTVYDLRKFPVDQQGRFFASVGNGKGNMPGFKDALSAEQMRWLWVYVSNRANPSQ